jgi:predicted  nucleic acid-binding Zn-ribbon protein
MSPVASVRAAKKALEETQKKLGAMETAVIRLTQEKDALAHRMKVRP